MTRTSLRTPGLRVCRLEDRAVPATWTVDDNSSKADFASIQAAIDAADAGDTIVVSPGVYVEQITVPADLDDLTIRTKSNGNSTVIQSPAALTGSKAVVRVAGADDVTIRGFVISAAGVPAGAVVSGVQVDEGGSARLDRLLVTSIGSPAEGTQTGFGVLIGGRQADGGTAGTATLTDSTIVNYQKGGVVIVNDGSSGTLLDNTIAGSGPNKAIAQNGVQVSNGANAVIAGNTISANNYVGSATDTTAVGVLVSDAGTVVVSANRVLGNQAGVFVEATNGVFVGGNTIVGSTLDGLVLFDLSGAAVVGNRITGSGRDGIQLEDVTGSLLLGNRVRDNGEYGLSLLAGATGNTIVLNDFRGNDGFDVFAETAAIGTANVLFLNRVGDSKNVP